MMHDVIVVGGGPAGMMAAIAAAENGARVCLLEPNERLGKKLNITGKGRCNVTNNCSAAELQGKVLCNGKFLYSAFSQFDPGDVMRFFEDHGVPLKTERGNRVFPVSDRSFDVSAALEKYLRALSVDRARDRRELAICRQFLEQKRPILGICRGAQVLAVAMGGTLLADVPGHGPEPGGADRIHDTRTAGLLTALYGPDCPVNSCHHQAVETLPPDCAVLQVALDGVIEAFGSRRMPAVGVQWHPERLCGPCARADAVSGLPLLGWFRAVCGGRP